MNNSLLQVKITQRVNKLSSYDYSNIETWMIIEAFNKAMDARVEREIQGINLTKSTAEGSLRSIDKLQVLLTAFPLLLTNTISNDYYNGPLPNNYLDWSRVSGYAKTDCCPKRKLKIYITEETNLDEILLDPNKNPSFNWAETICTLMGDEIKIFTNGLFTIEEPILTYYRTPKHIEIAGVVNPDTGIVSTTDIECELYDSLTENIIDEAAAILASDMDNYNKKQELSQRVEHNN